MSTDLGPGDLERFQSVVTRVLGLRFDDARQRVLSDVLGRRSGARRMSAASYLDALTSSAPVDEVYELARELAVGETYFFRHLDQFEAVREIVLPERLLARRGRGPVRLLSAGCASGEEAYSLAILARELGLTPRTQVEVLGVDANLEALAKARRGTYSSWSLRETPDSLRQRWFALEAEGYRLDDDAREGVTFEQHNLMREGGDRLSSGSFDVVFCRNVLMYFTPEHAAAIVARLSRWLVPGGYLFLGHAENLRGLSRGFGLQHTHNTFYYQLRGAALPDTAPPLRVERASPAPMGAAAGAWVEPWLDAVERSSQRILELSNRSPAPASTPGPAPPAPRPGEAGASAVVRAHELLRAERFVEALELLATVSAEDKLDPGVLLLRAALLTHQGDLPAAEAACHQLLERDGLNAGAHYLLALCLERSGQFERAAEHDVTAGQLDPSFAMPHLHLGLMARRKQDSVRARAELGTALLLLEREEAARLLLFGGGFARSALLALCRMELANLERAT